MCPAAVRTSRYRVWLIFTAEHGDVRHRQTGTGRSSGKMRFNFLRSPRLNKINTSPGIGGRTYFLVRRVAWRRRGKKAFFRCVRASGARRGRGFPLLFPPKLINSPHFCTGGILAPGTRRKGERIGGLGGKGKGKTSPPRHSTAFCTRFFSVICR